MEGPKGGAGQVAKNTPKAGTPWEGLSQPPGCLRPAAKLSCLELGTGERQWQSTQLWGGLGDVPNSRHLDRGIPRYGADPHSTWPCHLPVSTLLPPQVAPGTGPGGLVGPSLTGLLLSCNSAGPSRGEVCRAGGLLGPEPEDTARRGRGGSSLRGPSCPARGLLGQRTVGEELSTFSQVANPRWEGCSLRVCW